MLPRAWGNPFRVAIFGCLSGGRATPGYGWAAAARLERTRVTAIREHGLVRQRLVEKPGHGLSITPFQHRLLSNRLLARCLPFGSWSLAGFDLRPAGFCPCDHPRTRFRADPPSGLALSGRCGARRGGGSGSGGRFCGLDLCPTGFLRSRDSGATGCRHSTLLPGFRGCGR